MTAAIEHVQAAAFDLDGTLCDSVPDLAAAAEAMREYLGMEPLPAKTVESYVGDGIGKLVHRVITKRPRPRSRARFMGKKVSCST